MATHRWMTLQKEFEKGTPLTAVDAPDIKLFYEAQQAHAVMFGPPKPNTATGLAALGIDVSKRGPGFDTELFFITTRLGLLSTLLGRGILKDFENGDVLDERV